MIEISDLFTVVDRLIILFLTLGIWLVFKSLRRLEERNVLLEVLIMSLKSEKEPSIIQIPLKTAEEKLPGANRKPRTDEQKWMASLRRKEWWEKKKASESSLKNSET